MNGRILDLDAADYGDYTCFASNSLGNDHQMMTLFGKSLPSLIPACATVACGTSSIILLVVYPVYCRPSSRNSSAAGKDHKIIRVPSKASTVS